MPSGRAPRSRKAMSFKAAMAKVLRRDRGGARVRAKARIATPPPSASSRRVVVKVRVVQVGADWGKKAATLHLAYLQRDGVEREGGAGALYGEQGSVERSAFEEDLPGEEHQFRIVLSPEDAHELDLHAYVRTYLRRLEQDLGQKLRWAAVNHYNTDNPHAHVVIRGVDAEGREVRMDREYVSHGLRHRAQELATQELGPRPERSRLEQVKREAALERYTSLDRVLERRAVGGVVRPPAGTARDRHFEAAVRARLEVLERLGLSTRTGWAEWTLNPRLRRELDEMDRRAEGMRAIGAVLQIGPERCRVIQRNEPREGHRAELEDGVQGIVRWKGLDEDGQFCLVIETTAGAAYHLPISGRVTEQARVGQVLDLKRATDKDHLIEETACKQAWAYDVSSLPENVREAFRRRVEQLERMGLATPEAPERWRLRPDFRAEVARGKQQPYWQMLSLRADRQPLADQTTYLGHVWIDRIRLDQIGSTGFGREVSNAQRIRYEYLRGLGLTPQSPRLRWQLRDLQQKRLEQIIVASEGRIAVRATGGFAGILHMHQERNGERFAEIRAQGHFVLCAASRHVEDLEGRPVRIELGDKGRVNVVGVDRDKGRERT